ncbi:pheromone B alpha 1 receptor [Mycena rebaudengoi]|nr:pheromone B alpha 1 receptor [Mycena rebaudengoi]
MVYFYNGPPNAVFSVFSFLGFSAVQVLILLPSAWNTGTCLYMIWSAVANLIFFVNSIVWAGNTIDWSPTYCDISTHILTGFNVAIPACSLAINRRLYQISSVRTVTKSKAERRRAIMIDLAIGLGIPLLAIPLQYVVQGHRYDIYQDIGCMGETFETPVSVVLYHLPPLLIGLVSGVYACLSIKAFYHSRAQFKELLMSSNNNNLNLNRYVRLMCLASTDVLCSVPLASYVLWTNTSVWGINKWISWEDTHSNFSRVGQVPGIIWRSNAFLVSGLESFRWLTVGCAFLFFAYFGFADEAIKNYRSAFFSVAKRVGYSTATMSSGVTSSNGASSKYPHMSSRPGAMPVFIRKETARKHDSFDSFSDMSASFGALDYVDKEKTLNTTGSFGTLSLNDVGGLLPDYKETSLSEPEPSSSSSSGSSTGPPSRSSTPVPPQHDDIEISSLHRSSVYVSPPEPAHTTSPRNPADMV